MENPQHESRKDSVMPQKNLVSLRAVITYRPLRGAVDTRNAWRVGDAQRRRSAQDRFSLATRGCLSAPRSPRVPPPAATRRPPREGEVSVVVGIFFKKKSNMNEDERSTSSASLHAHTQLHHPTLRFFNRLPPLSVTLHFLREFFRKIEHGTCSATLYRAYSSNPKNCE